MVKEDIPLTRCIIDYIAQFSISGSMPALQVLCCDVSDFMPVDAKSQYMHFFPVSIPVSIASIVRPSKTLSDLRRLSKEKLLMLDGKSIYCMSQIMTTISFVTALASMKGD